MAARPSISFEFFPPAPGAAEARFWDTVERLAPLEPEFVSITYGAGGTTRERSDRILRAFIDRARIDRTGVAPAGHLTCVGASRAEIDALAHAWAEAGLSRVVALRGDMPGLRVPYAPHPEGYRDAADLVAGLRRIADFDISVGAYPECHPDSTDLACDLDNLKRKFDAGASRALTQYFFDAEAYLRFRDRAARAGIRAPIVPGIMPIANFAKLCVFSRRCGASIPTWLAERFAGLDDDPETRAMVAATTASELCRRLLAEGVSAFHFYTLNQAPLCTAVCRMLGAQPAFEVAA
jgi:methylenetetrahydrofolate reductase (NADPH)